LTLSESVDSAVAAHGRRTAPAPTDVRENLTVATPPPVTAADARAAIDRIAARRAQLDDPNAWRLSEDPVEVLAYLQRYSAGVPRWVAEADILDGLTLRFRLWWLGEESELWLLERARRLGVPPRRIAPRLGVASRQAVHDRLRLARDKMARLRGTPPVPAGDAHQASDAQRAWMRAHRDEILEIGRLALTHRGQADEVAAEWLVEVARDVREEAVSSGSIQTLRFALLELAGDPLTAGLDESHPLTVLLQRWARLYASRPQD
jgi:hypothetical protein